jgi:small neutral amino acid transporter SnatA (MarC family)
MFVAISINLKQVIESAGLADRAASALLLLLAILIAGLLLAMPDQPVAVLGVEAAATAIAAGIITTLLGVRGLRKSEPQFRRNFTQNVATNIAALAPILIGGVLMLGGGEAGFYWVGAGMCLAIIKAVSEGWIFLVEINR